MTATTTPVHDDLACFTFECIEVFQDLTCYFEYEEPEEGSREPISGMQLEPDYPEVWTLLHVYLPNSDVDLSGILHPAILDEIQTAAEEYFENMKEQL